MKILKIFLIIFFIFSFNHLKANNEIMKNNEGYMVLGTGSPSAAKIYGSYGFRHLAGGLDTDSGGVKGYNPDDLGEWIMIRKNGGNENKLFDASKFYDTGNKNIDNVEQMQIVPCTLSHYTHLVLLFNAIEGQIKNISSLNISTGIQAEGSLVEMYTTPLKYNIEIDKCNNIFLLKNKKNNKIIGIASLLNAPINVNDQMEQGKEAKEGVCWEIYSVSKVGETMLQEFCKSL